MRSLPPSMISALQASTVFPAYLLDITFASGPAYVWSGVGNLSFSGNQYLGVGSMGEIGTIQEITDVHPVGTQVQLSGIDQVLQQDCLNDIQIGAPASLTLATLDPVAKSIVASYPIFAGTVDKPVHRSGPDSLTIALSLENRLYNLQRASSRRYTAADQRVHYTDDIAFNWVEVLNDAAFLWGAK